MKNKKSYVIQQGFNFRIKFLILAVFVLFLSTQVFYGAGTVVDQYGWLKITGTHLCDQNGKPVQLRGMSLFWSQWSTPFWNPSVINNLADNWKATVVRAAMGVEMGGYLDNSFSEKRKVITVVDAAIAKGIYVIIDWHDHNALKHLDQSKDFFKEMAEKYKSKPNVIFEIFNEPLNTASWTAVKAYSEAVIGDIRATGSSNIVLVGTPTWSQDVDAAALDPITKYNNLAYSLHFYAGTHKQGLRDKASKAISSGLALFVSEWGTCDSSGNGALDLEESKVWLKFIDDNKLSWCNWSLNNKKESASALQPFGSTTELWKDDELTPSGLFVRDILRTSSN